MLRPDPGRLQTIVLLGDFQMEENSIETDLEDKR